jgi:hypothetical protein
MTTEKHHIHTGLTVQQHHTLLTDAKKGLPMTDIPAGAAARRAKVRDLEGVTIYRGAESLVVSAANANDMVNHNGWSLAPTHEFLDAQTH